MLLSKPLGTGIVTTAAMRDCVEQSAFDAAVTSMKQLNLMASKTAIAHDVACMTDVTGFGLIGHLLEMTKDTGLCAHITMEYIPMLPTVAALAAAGVVPGGLQRNRTLYESQGLVQYDASIPSSLIDILYDPQTSGGLLVTLPAADCESLIAAGAAVGVSYVHIGTLTAGVGVSVLP